jgi:TolA-binding protein
MDRAKEQRETPHLLGPDHISIGRRLCLHYKMADSSAGPPPDTTTANLTTLQAELESLRSDSTRQSIEAEEALHDLAAKLASVEQLLEQEKVQNQSITQREEQERKRATELEEQLTLEREKHKGAGDEELQRRNKEQELIKDKRELLEVLDREQADKKQLEGESQPASPCLGGERLEEGGKLYSLHAGL